MQKKETNRMRIENSEKEQTARMKCIYIRNNTHTHTKESYFHFSFSTRFTIKPYIMVSILYIYVVLCLRLRRRQHCPILFSHFILNGFFSSVFDHSFFFHHHLQCQEKIFTLCVLGSLIWLDFCRHCTIVAVCNVVKNLLRKNKLSNEKRSFFSQLFYLQALFCENDFGSTLFRTIYTMNMPSSCSLFFIISVTYSFFLHVTSLLEHAMRNIHSVPIQAIFHSTRCNIVRNEKRQQKNSIFFLLHFY